MGLVDSSDSQQFPLDSSSSSFSTISTLFFFTTAVFWLLSRSFNSPSICDSSLSYCDFPFKSPAFLFVSSSSYTIFYFKLVWHLWMQANKVTIWIGYYLIIYYKL
eukprot:TRINITY_DN14320_c0_g1_i1.p1 TRINITY_DN14320_c0_g1~~TRINITY_DN14320_c0_g1_i1.p1  ORF type:complete len:105 (-),score=9.51 TRINITY_DN14320_c0_g1_i1:60-374(-)